MKNALLNLWHLLFMWGNLLDYLSKENQRRLSKPKESWDSKQFEDL